MPVLGLKPELHTSTHREIGVFCLGDENDTFVLLNLFVGGDAWSEEINDYSAPIYETVVLRAGPDVFEEITTGPNSTANLEWAGGSGGWNTVPVELLLQNTELVLLAVNGAQVYTTCFEGAPHDFLVELELFSPIGEWRLSRSVVLPNFFALVSGQAGCVPGAVPDS
jgi:hypothetical protein